MTGDIWSETLSRHSGGNNFFEQLGPDHKVLFIDKGSDTLVVTFDNLDDSRQKSDRLPWGVDFITSQGWSSLGLMAHGSTWYRDEAVCDFFDRLQDQRFYDRFSRVVFYGTSMGGYAACTFSASCPGATVMAVNPQATLCRDRAGWETRFRPAWRRDFHSRYGFAPDQVRHAEKLWLFYDSRILQDSMHASLFAGDNVEKIKCPLMGHGVLSVWRDMGVLKQISAACIDGTATRLGICKLLRTRHQSLRYQKLLLNHLLRLKRHDLIVPYCQAILSRRPGPHFRNALNESQTILAQRRGTA